jgi:hypothetical protein
VEVFDFGLVLLELGFELLLVGLFDSFKFILIQSQFFNE